LQDNVSGRPLAMLTRISRQLVVLACGATVLIVAAGARGDDLAERFKTLTKSSQWVEVDQVKVGFVTHHPQGMVKIGDQFFVSSVEIVAPTQRFEQPQGGYDRTPGKGVGHLFKMGADGALIESVTLGEGDIYHPGGIDYDGRWLWVPVAEYRPNSASIVYRVDPETLGAEEVFRFRDHIGGIVHDTDTNTLHGVSWGSRRFYAWRLDEQLAPAEPDVEPEQIRALNPSHYIDYQDCHYAGASQMLCSGLNKYEVTGAGTVALGGLELVDLTDNRPVHQVPVPLWVSPDLAMTNNPVACEAAPAAFRCYFMPQDDESALFIYEVRD
jgi:Family of unknown function (DUF6454)